MIRTVIRLERRRGFTLVELIVAIALATIIVGILASVSIQTQRAIAVSSMREDASRIAIGILGDVERDVAGMLPISTAPTPFAATERALQLEMIEAAATTGGPRRDRLRVFTTIRAPDGAGDLVRAVVEWKLQPRVVDESKGDARGVLTRQVDKWARAGDAATTDGPRLPVPDRTPNNLDGSPVIGTDVVSFEVEWQDAAANGEYKPAGAAGSNIADGSLWVRDGTVDITNDVTGTMATATVGAADLEALPIGAEMGLELPTGERVRMLVRRKVPPVGSGKVLLHDRITKDQSGVRFNAFRGPPALRVTVVVPFGMGPDSGTARFSRTFPVPR